MKRLGIITLILMFVAIVVAAPQSAKAHNSGGPVGTPPEAPTN